MISLKRLVLWPTIAAAVMAVAVLVAFAGQGAGSAAQYVPSSPVRIVGDGALASSGAVSAGTGTSSDPYIIENLEIMSSGQQAVGISLQNTRAHVVIRGCYIANCSSGVMLYNVSNARVESCILVDNGIGVTVSYSSDCSVTRNNITRSIVGVGLYYSDDISVKDNAFLDNEMNIEKRTAFAPWETTWIGTAVCVALAIPLVLLVVVLVGFRMQRKRSEKRPPGQGGSP